jgi:hypothetical protein
MRSCKQGKEKLLNNEIVGTTKERMISGSNKMREMYLKRDEMVMKRNFRLMTV